MFTTTFICPQPLSPVSGYRSVLERLAGKCSAPRALYLPTSTPSRWIVLVEQTGFRHIWKSVWCRGWSDALEWRSGFKALYNTAVPKDLWGGGWPTLTTNISEAQVFIKVWLGGLIILTGLFCVFWLRFQGFCTILLDCLELRLFCEIQAALCFQYISGMAASMNFYAQTLVKSPY